MILGIVSDSHGNHRLLSTAIECLHQHDNVDTIVHLGDDYEDAEWLEYAGYLVIKVPGLWCDAYRDKRVPKSMLFQGEGLRIACAHTLDDISKDNRNAPLILTGHTHRAAIQKKNRTLFVNPGHLRAPRDRGEKASFAAINIGTDAIRVSIRELDGSIRLYREFPRNEVE